MTAGFNSGDIRALNPSLCDESHAISDAGSDPSVDPNPSGESHHTKPKPRSYGEIDRPAVNCIYVRSQFRNKEHPVWL